MPLAANDLWTIAAAVLGGIACGVPGVFLVLRRMSLLGDAISHAVLPGLAMAFILTGSRGVLPMLVGALATGLLTAVLAPLVTRLARVPEDASLGVVFTALFSLGVLLISIAARSVDLDPGCVLYGLIEFVPFDTWQVAGHEIPRAPVILGAFALLNVSLVAVFYKELKIVAFDAALATAMGISAALVHYGLMAVVASTVVACFESVGSILVVAMLVAPGATAGLFTRRLPPMLILAGVLAVTAAVLGYFLAVHWNTSVAGMISVMLGVQFGLGVLVSPTDGLFTRFARRASLSLRIAQEDVLGRLFRHAEGTRPVTAMGTLPPLPLAILRARGLVMSSPAGPVLSPRGFDEARRLIGAHRLWESFLRERLNLPVDHLHDPAETMEHFISPELLQSLRAEFEGRMQDPQGKPIP